MAAPDQQRFMKGAFASWDPGTYPSDSDVVYIPFRSNPESLTRSIKIEQGQGASGTPAGGKDSTAKAKSTDASSGLLTESFSIKVRFDVAERSETVQQSMNLADGILPEIGAMEALMYPFSSTSAGATDGANAPYQVRSVRKVALFIFGKYLKLPIRVTGMTINETVHNYQLIPLRAEVDVQCEVLNDFEKKSNKAAVAALNYQQKRRNQMAKLAINASQDLIFDTVTI
jgi:hypothetical protein